MIVYFLNNEYEAWLLTEMKRLRRFEDQMKV